MFNNFFADQCSILRNKIELPPTISLSFKKKKKKKKRKKLHESLTTIDFSNNNILKIIRSLDPNKARGHDMISITMVKICDDSISKPLKLIFEPHLLSGKIPSKWKKTNVIPLHKKGDKHILKTLPANTISSYYWERK